jgi:hypothetical protein
MAGLLSSDNYPKAPSNGQILISFGHSRFSYSDSSDSRSEGRKAQTLKKNVKPMKLNFLEKNVTSVLWNRNYFLWFRFRLLKSYGSGSNFCQDTVPVPYQDHKKHSFQKHLWKKSCLFTFQAFLQGKNG